MPPNGPVDLLRDYTVVQLENAMGHINMHTAEDRSMETDNNNTMRAEGSHCNGEVEYTNVCYMCHQTGLMQCQCS